jgi:hypothetical protein
MYLEAVSKDTIKHMVSTPPNSDILLSFRVAFVVDNPLFIRHIAAHTDRRESSSRRASLVIDAPFQLIPTILCSHQEGEPSSLGLEILRCELPARSSASCYLSS